MELPSIVTVMKQKSVPLLGSHVSESSILHTGFRNHVPLVSPAPKESSKFREPYPVPVSRLYVQPVRFTVLYLYNSVIHNSSGEGLSARHSTVVVDYCQFSNTFGDCLGLYGCEAVVQHSTLAQFYPFSANRGFALHFMNTKLMPMTLVCTNTLVTGYADDVVMQEVSDTTIVCDYHFADCLLRTPKIDDDSVRLERIIWETPEDSVQGKQHFKTIDEENLFYDFTLDSISPAFQNGIGRMPVNI